MTLALDRVNWAAAAPHPGIADTFRIRLFFCFIAGLTVASGLLISPGSLLGDPDNWWHVRVGLDILDARALPTVDTYSHTFAGQPWIAKEWLAQVLMALAYEAGGWNGVVLLTIGAVALTASLVCWHLSAALKPLVAVALTLVVAVFIAPLYNARPFALTLPIMVVWTATLFDAARRERAPPFWLLPFLCLWASLHAAFTFAFVIAFFAGLDVLARVRFTQPRLIARWVGFGLLCPLVCLVHPYGVQAILATLSVAHGNEAVALIGEWQPFNAAKDFPQEIILLLGLFGLAVSRLRIGWPTALFLLFALHLFLVHGRFVYLPALALLVIAADAGAQFSALSMQGWATARRDGLEQMIAARFPALTGGLAALVILGLGLFATTAATAPSKSTSAEAALAYARAHHLSGNVLNSYDLGGTLIFHGVKTFIDGRTDQLFLNGFMNREDRSGSSAGQPILIETLEKYAIGWALLTDGDPRIPFFDGLPGWRRLYADDDAVIYARN